MLRFFKGIFRLIKGFFRPQSRAVSADQIDLSFAAKPGAGFRACDSLEEYDAALKSLLAEKRTYLCIDQRQRDGHFRV